MNCGKSGDETWKEYLWRVVFFIICVGCVGGCVFAGYRIHSDRSNPPMGWTELYVLKVVLIATATGMVVEVLKFLRMRLFQASKMDDLYRKKMIRRIALLSGIAIIADGEYRFGDSLYPFHRTRSVTNACMSNLRQIDGAIDQYMLDHDNKRPKSMSDLVPAYITRTPRCPQSDPTADYPLTSPPTCPGHIRGHSLPP